MTSRAGYRYDADPANGWTPRLHRDLPFFVTQVTLLIPPLSIIILHNTFVDRYTAMASFCRLELTDLRGRIQSGSDSIPHVNRVRGAYGVGTTTHSLSLNYRVTGVLGTFPVPHLLRARSDALGRQHDLRTVSLVFFF